MMQKAINYFKGVFCFFSAFAIGICLKKGYDDFVGIPIWAYVSILIVLTIVNIIMVVKSIPPTNYTL